MPSYTLDQLDDLELAAEDPSLRSLDQALALISGLFEQHGITYGIIGGMNFYVRGSGRTTEDIDIVVDNIPRMDSLLNIFNGSNELVSFSFHSFKYLSLI